MKGAAPARARAAASGRGGEPPTDDINPLFGVSTTEGAAPVALSGHGFSGAVPVGEVDDRGVGLLERRGRGVEQQRDVLAGRPLGDVERAAARAAGQARALAREAGVDA